MTPPSEKIFGDGTEVVPEKLSADQEEEYYLSCNYRAAAVADIDDILLPRQLEGGLPLLYCLEGVLPHLHCSCHIGLSLLSKDYLGEEISPITKKSSSYHIAHGANRWNK